MITFLKKNWFYIAAFCGLALYFFFKSKSKSTTVVSTGKTADTNEDLNKNMGQKNNNPLNIRNTALGETPWKGGVNGPKGFVIFDSIELGYRAGIKTLWTYFNIHKIRTIHDIINRFAPARENDTTGYVAFVSKGSAIPANAVIEFDRDTIDKIICEMSQMETAMRPTDEQLNKAWELSSL